MLFLDLKILADLDRFSRSKFGLNVHVPNTVRQDKTKYFDI